MEEDPAYRKAHAMDFAGRMLALLSVQRTLNRGVTRRCVIFSRVPGANDSARQVHAHGHAFTFLGALLPRGAPRAAMVHARYSSPFTAGPAAVRSVIKP